MADRGLGFAERRPPPPPGYETPEQFAARKRREAAQRDRAEWERRQRLQRQRDQDPYGDVTMDSQGRPQWRYGAPHVGPKVVDDTVRGLDAVPGPHRAITGPYAQYRDDQQNPGQTAPPQPPRRRAPRGSVPRSDGREAGPGFEESPRPGPWQPDGDQSPSYRMRRLQQAHRSLKQLNAQRDHWRAQLRKATADNDRRGVAAATQEMQKIQQRMSEIESWLSINGDL